MRRASFIFVSAILTLGDPGTAPASSERIAMPASLAVHVLAAQPGAAPSATIDALERAGYRVHVFLLPGTAYVTETATAGPLPSGVVPIEAPPDLDAGRLGLLLDAPNSWEEPTDAHDPFEGRPDAIPPAADGRSSASRAPITRSTPDLPSGLPYGARWEDTSEFMIGRVAVPILFPESDGTIDPNHFDWTPALRDSVIRSAVRGFLKWSLFASARDIPLTFLIEIHANLATRYEPIDRPVAQEGMWLADMLEPVVGYRTSALPMAYDFANMARARLNTHWAALAVAVQNDTSSTGTFPDGLIAHAKLGGPWFVIPVNNLKTTSAKLDFYFEHEITHQFWALDEFPAANAWWGCNLYTGYFNRPNWNASVPADGYCGIPTVHCVMKGNYPDDFCSYTLGQIGWVDGDGTGTLDFFETRPTVRPDSSQYRTGAGNAITLRGTASESAIPNENPYHYFAGDSISIATIDSLQYRVDLGQWSSLPCEGGPCDSGEERFTLVLPPPTPGSHVVEYRAWNSNGKTQASSIGTMITVSGTSGSFGGSDEGETPAAPRLSVAPTPARGAVRLELRARPGSVGSAMVADVSGRVVHRWPLAVPPNGLLTWGWDSRRGDGGRSATGLYFVVVKIGPETLAQRIIVLR